MHDTIKNYTTPNAIQLAVKLWCGQFHFLHKFVQNKKCGLDGNQISKFDGGIVHCVFLKRPVRDWGRSPVNLMGQLDGLSDVVAKYACAVITHWIVAVVLIANINASNVSGLIEKTNYVLIALSRAAVAILNHLKAWFFKFFDCVNCFHLLTF